MEKIPVFGTYNPEFQYIRRPGVYGIMVNQNHQVVVIQKPDGALFLPGGGLEAYETASQGLRREIQEELGCELLSQKYFQRAHEYSYSSSDSTNYFFLNEFYLITVDPDKIHPTEEDHKVCWVDQRDAKAQMMHKSHAWVLGLFEAQFQK